MWGMERVRSSSWVVVGGEGIVCVEDGAAFYKCGGFAWILGVYIFTKSDGKDIYVQWCDL